MEAMLEQMHRGEREGPVAVMLGQIDGFDQVNDWYGFREVDAMMRRMSARLVGSLEQMAIECSGDYVLGGFARGRIAVALFGGLAAAAPVIAGRLRDDLMGTYILDGRPRKITFSVGCTRPEAVPQLDQVLSIARMALEAAVEAGGDRIELSDPGGLDVHARTRLLGRDLQLAIAREQLRLEYQPIFSLDPVTVVGMEALLRWNHPVLGRVSPAEFIPIAAASGYLGELGDWVLGRACKDFTRLQQAGTMEELRFVSVNVSRQNLGDACLRSKVRDALDAAGMKPEALHLEITESELARNLSQAVATVTAVRDLGVKVAIDDFGVGYSSLASLHQFPVDMLKLDRSILLRDFSGSQGRGLLAVAHAIINLARNVELDVVAEGVETVEQMALLQSMQCPLAQGYFLSRPLSIESLLNGPPVLHCDVLPAALPEEGALHLSC
jgi:EAL domain-containing protein (putative c-di-GMP-specific phosphodiesterase class I)/GGDEF domain-containing protein